MSYLNAILLGLIQGLTEFLPVSSSGHLVLAQHLLGFQGPTVAFDLLLHLGTLLAVVIYFSGDLLQIAYSTMSYSSESNGRRWLGMLILGSIPTAVIGLIFKDPLERLFGEPHIVSLMLWVTALLLWLSDRVWVRESAGRKVHAHQAIIVGIVQGIAIIPGISRSGSTISAGLFTGLNPSTAARFSFLLSIPAIIGASLLEVKHFAQMNSADWLPSLTGMAIAFLVGYISIEFLMRILVKRKLWKFSVYLFLLGALGLILT